MFNGDDNEIVTGAPLAKQMLGLGHEVGVIVEEHRTGQLGGDGGRERHVALFERGRPIDKAALGVDHPRHTDADPGEILNAEAALCAGEFQRAADLGT